MPGRRQRDLGHEYAAHSEPPSPFPDPSWGSDRLTPGPGFLPTDAVAAAPDPPLPDGLCAQEPRRVRPTQCPCCPGPPPCPAPGSECQPWGGWGPSDCWSLLVPLSSGKTLVHPPQSPARGVSWWASLRRLSQEAPLAGQPEVLQHEEGSVGAHLRGLPHPPRVGADRRPLPWAVSGACCPLGGWEWGWGRAGVLCAGGPSQDSGKAPVLSIWPYSERCPFLSPGRSWRPACLECRSGS